MWHTGRLLATSSVTILDFWPWVWIRFSSSAAAWMFPLKRHWIMKYMIHVCHKITLSYPQRRCPLAYHKGMWGREARRRLFRCVFEAVGLQRVRSLSPSEEKHWSTIWSETSSSVDGLHFGLWSLSTSTGNTQRVRIKRKKYEWTAPLISSSHHVRLLSPCSAVTYRLLRPHRSRSLSAKQQKQSRKKTPNMVI